MERKMVGSPHHVRKPLPIHEPKPNLQVEEHKIKANIHGDSHILSNPLGEAPDIENQISKKSIRILEFQPNLQS